MHSRSGPQVGTGEPIPRALHSAEVEEDPEILALWAAAMNSASYTEAVAASADELTRGPRDRKPRSGWSQ